jgi:hypothetical protein
MRPREPGAESPDHGDTPAPGPAIVAAIVVGRHGCDWLEDSGFSNCAIADDERSFTGEWLANDGRPVVSRRPTGECMSADRALDGGDGNRSGGVRWAVCSKGPDCYEAGLF